MELFWKFFTEEGGASIVEYALLIFPLAITFIFTLSYLSEGIEKAFTNVGNAIKKE